MEKLIIQKLICRNQRIRFQNLILPQIEIDCSVESLVKNMTIIKQKMKILKGTEIDDKISEKNYQFKLPKILKRTEVVKKTFKKNSQFKLSWSHTGASINKLAHVINGNRKIGYNIAVWNCRKGLISKQGAASPKVADIEQYLGKHQLHALGIVECDLHGPGSRMLRSHPLSTKDIHEKLHIEGYNILLPQSWYMYDQARIFIYIKENLQVKERKLQQENSDLPSISFELGLSREKKTCINFFYREFTGGISGLNDQASQLDRITRQIEHWKSLFRGGRDVVVLGDSNLCAKQWNDQNYNMKHISNKVQDFLLEETCEQLVTDLTRSEIANGVVQSSCIDHCYSDSGQKISGPFVEAVGNSDHLGVRIIKYSKNPPTKPQVIRKRVYKNFSTEAFLTDILHSNINNSVTTHDNIETAAEAFRNEFQAILDHHAPVRTIQMRKHYCPYLTVETKIKIRERNALQAEATKWKDPVLAQEFKEKAKEVKKAVEADKKYGREKALGDSTTSKQAWQTAKNILGMSQNLAPTALKDEDEGLVTNPTKMATILNSFFLQKVRLLREKTNKPPKIDPEVRLQNWLESRMEQPPIFRIKEIDKKTLRILIRKMKGGRSSGVDNIDSFSLKIAAPLLEDALLHLINLSIRTKIFSQHWKHQLIFPNYKKQDRFQAKNYRPVSHLVEVGLLVEKAVSLQVLEHFLSHGLFHENHHGGLAHHSTASALIQLHDMFLEAAENKKLSAALLLDQSAAYDLLDHSILLRKLKIYNFEDETVEWFHSYLSGRSQSVQVEAGQSSKEELWDHAAPQGSVLGGLLFIINENDFPACRDEGDSVLFVDDDSDVVSDQDPKELVQKIQKEANLSCDWLQDNRMVVAGEKSKLIIVGTQELKKRKLGEDIRSIQVDGKVVTESPSEKLLGVIVNNKMTWHEHLYGETWRTEEENSKGLLPQLSQRVGILTKLSNYTSKKKLRMLISGIFYSKLFYCFPLYINTWNLDNYREGRQYFTSYTKEDNRRVQVLQNKVSRLLLDRQERGRILRQKQNLSTEDLLVKTGFLSIHQLGAQYTLVMIKKIILSRKPSYLARKIIPSQDGRPTRSGMSLTTIKTSLNIRRSSFLYRGVKLYNQLPESIRSLPKIDAFKEEVRAWVKLNVNVKP